MVKNIGVWNDGTVVNQTNNVTIVEGQKIQLVYSDPLPDRSLFQGRQSELKQLDGWLKDAATSIIGVRGEGGIGKSTLAAKAFDDCLGFAGKVWFDVRAGTSITDLAERALQELGMSSEQMQSIEKKDLPQRLLRQLQLDRYLLVLDNLESLLTPDGLWLSGYEEFFDQFPTLGRPSVLLLAGREYPPKYFGWLHSNWLAVEHGLEPTEGATLLEALEAEGTEAERAAVSTQVQGHPLALSLLAGWLRETFRKGNRSVQQLATQADLFQVQGKHWSEKQISVERVFDWSFKRLSPDSQQLLTQVSILRGSFTREAASALVQRVVEDGELQDVERRSLLQELPAPDQSGSRLYRLQPRIQDFAQKRVGNLTEAHERAIAYFWSHRQTTFEPTDTQEAVSDYLETFYHERQLERYQAAAQTVFACDQFLTRRGYVALLADLYTQLNTQWQPTPDQRQDYAALSNNLGNAYRSLGQYQRAIEYQEQSLAIQREIGNRNGEAASLGNLGNAYRSLGQYQRAIEYQEQSLAIQREIGNRNGEANSLGNLGNAYDSLGQYQRAIEYQEQSLAIQREIGNRNGEANSLGNLGNAYDSLGQYQRAIEYQEQSLAIQREIGNRNGEANSLGNLGNAYDSLGQYQRAIEYQEQSLAIEREIGNRNGEANSLGNLGNAYDSLGQYQRAIEYQEQSLAIEREIGDRNGEAASLGNLGNAYRSLGQYQRAIEYQEQSLAIQREIGDRNGEANSLGSLGNAYRSLGQYQRAIEYQEQSLAIQREIGDRNGEANSLGNLGNAYDSLGQYQRAIEYQEQSLAIEREIGDRNGEAASLGNLGNAYRSLGQYQRAIEYQEQSLAIQREIGNRNGEANSLGNLGNAYRSLGQYQRAIEYQEQSLAIQREIGNRNGEANSLGNLGNAYDSLGQYQRAIEYQEQSLAIQREIGNRNGEANSLGNLGNAYRSLGQYQRAIEYQEQSLAIEREIGDRNGEANSLFNKAFSLARLDQHFNARQCFQQALTIFEDLKLDHRIEQCKAAITQCSQIIAAEPQSVPQIRDEPAVLPDWYLKSLPANEKRAAPRSVPKPKLWLWFTVGVTFVLLIWWLKK